jgi:hypothetical protein
MKITRIVEHVGLPALIASVLAKDTMVEITDDGTVDKHAGAGAINIGFVRVPARVAGEQGTIETRFRATGEAKADGAIAAGDSFKMSSEAPAGTQRVKKWVGQTDAVAGDKPETADGVCWVGGGDGDTVTLLFY